MNGTNCSGKFLRYVVTSRGIKESLKKVKEVFICNGYPKKFVNRVMKDARKRRQHKKNDGDPDKFIYIKLPYINEEYKRRVTSVIRRSGINNVKACFVNGKPLSKVFIAPKRQINCSSECETCKSATKPNQCFRKNVIYEIKCLHYGIQYIGETGRTIGSRIKEHLSMDKQTVFKHIMSHKRRNKQDKPNSDDITWRIIYKNIKYQGERRCIEAIEIQKHSTNIMNCCIGRIIII